MEQILRSEEMAEITKKAFSYDNQVVYFPVRHHSPACSYHLQKVIEEYEPECILIEGPESANEMLDVMTDEETVAPFAIYYSYKDSKGYVTEEKEEYKCYYPFLDYSPELVAVRQGRKRGIHTAFFDLPYAEILIASEENRGLRKKEDKNNYNDDYYLAENRFIQTLVEKSGLRCFDEFWEKYFEINGPMEETGEFVGDLLYYCVLSRLTSEKRKLQEDGCLAREAYMYQNIRKAQENYGKILVVTGGFHTYGLLKLAEAAEKSQKNSLHNIPDECQGVFLMSYSMEAADGLNGYASGMPFPAFYQSVWEKLGDNTYDNVYQDTILKFLVDTGKEVRKKEGYPSTFDEICAYSMTGQLANLRGKAFPGAYELLDSVLSSYVKGEYNISTDAPMRALRKKLTGHQIGKLCKNAKVPPLVQHFEEMCRRYRFKIHSTLKTEVTLSIFASPRHREMSKFFYQMDFLDTGFARKIKGPNLRMKKDRNLIREIWSYKWSTQVIAALIDASVYGGTLEEACAALVGRKLKKDINGAKASELLIDMFEMGLSKQLDFAFKRLELLIQRDMDFFSLVKTFSNLLMLEELGELYQNEIVLEPFIQAVYRKVMYSLAYMAQVKEENLTETMEAVKNLYLLMNRPAYEDDRENLIQTLEEVLEKEGLHPGLEGCVMGILYGFGRRSATDIGRICNGYMAGTKEKLLSVAALFRGLFYTARDLLFVGDEFLLIINRFVAAVSDEDFMKLLPQFRLAFSYFTPSEIDRIAERVAGLHGISGRRFQELKAVTPEVFNYGVELEKQIFAVLEDEKRE